MTVTEDSWGPLDPIAEAVGRAAGESVYLDEALGWLLELLVTQGDEVVPKIRWLILGESTDWLIQHCRATLPTADIDNTLRDYLKVALIEADACRNLRSQVVHATWSIPDITSTDITYAARRQRRRQPLPDTEKYTIEQVRRVAHRIRYASICIGRGFSWGAQQRSDLGTDNIELPPLPSPWI